MTKRILIDARQTEETRVVLLSGNRIDDFDYETEHRKQLKGNVYLARVTRVEPSLQAAFVEYGGNRQGFLAFSEIHPDYYRIPIEDREALIEAEGAAHDDDAEDARNCFSCQFDPESFLYDDLNGVDLCEGMEVENIDGSMVTLTAADIAEFKPIYEEYGGTCN